MTNVRRVGAAKLLGVHLTQNLILSHSTYAVVTVLYLLAQLKRQGLDLSALDSVLTPLLPIKSYRPMHYLFTMDI